MANKKAKAVEQPETPTFDNGVRKSVAYVYAKNGGLIRSYTLEVHGAGFEALAEQMAAQHAGSRIDVL